jgi:P4 family phage/plasmid primase-like protien
LPEGQRSFSSGEWLFFDFDELSIDPKIACKEFVTCIEEFLGAENCAWGIVSGRGVHVLLRLPPYSEYYLEVHKSTYTHLSDLIKAKLTNFSFKVDPVFHKAKSLRLAGTVNRKPNQPDTECFVSIKPTNKNIKDYFTLYRLTYDSTFNLEVEEKKKADAVKQSAQKNHALTVISSSGEQVNTLPEKSSILEKCGFISGLENELANLPRDEWFKGVSLLTTLGMTEEAHNWSSTSPLYKHSEVESIIEGVQARGLYPMSCTTIKTAFSAELTSFCESCAFKSCKSPANLHNDPLLSVMGSGFKHLPEGAKKAVTDYDSLSLFMSKYLSVIYVKDRKSFYQWENETQLYTEKTEAELTNTACKLIKPRVIDPNSVIQRIAGAIEVNASKVEQKMLAPDGTIPLKNGLFSIQNGTLDPYTPKILTTNKLPYSYDPLAECPHFDKFLEERIGDPELIESVMLFLCYAIAGIKQPIRKILVLEGPAATGKSTFLTVIGELFGDLCAYGQLQNLVGRFETASFIDKRVVLFDEALSSRDQALIEVLKNLSGSEKIKVEKKGKDPQNVLNLGRIVIACNEIPKGGALDSGFMDRLLIVPMHSVLEYSERNYDEVSQILTEGSGILNKIVSYYARLKELRFIIPQPKASIEAIATYQEEDSSLVTFIKQECELVPFQKSESMTEMIASCHRPTTALVGVSLKDLREAIVDWAGKEGEGYFEKLSARSLGKMLDQLSKTTYKNKIKTHIDRKNRKYIQGLVLSDKTLHSTLVQKKDSF